MEKPGKGFLWPKLTIHCHADRGPSTWEKQVTGPGWVTTPPLLPKTEVRRVSRSTATPLRARAVTTECIGCDSTLFFLSLFSTKALIDVLVVLKITEENAGVAQVPNIAIALPL